MRTWWANLLCAYRGHDWRHDGAGSWSMTCQRCQSRFFLGNVRRG